MAESLHQGMAQWIQYKLGKQYLWNKITLPWESNPAPSPIDACTLNHYVANIIEYCTVGPRNISIFIFHFGIDSKNGNRCAIHIVWLQCLSLDIKYQAILNCEWNTYWSANSPLQWYEGKVWNRMIKLGRSYFHRAVSVSYAGLTITIQNCALFMVLGS